MPRTSRLERPGAWHHVIGRGNERPAIFLDGRDHGHFLDLVGGRKDWAIPLRELGKAGGGVDAVAVSMAARRLPGQAKRQPALRQALAVCREKLQMLNV